ncbi:sporulation protein [Ferrimonas lipolytica]|uniref:Sporulation protein n=1 Tax=Ferrimonas lipolytica TaxID=2724191 RepID=A0A6H1UA71_9GAMM|nr:sporulation protein [Ferrimonas lipolytica]QIZ75947.1 sporulation protein [Ferrimonas lipolytica]
MFSKLMASVGIGAAKVDTLILTEQLLPGQPFDIEIVIKGGNVAQQINGLTLALMVEAEVESGDSEGLQNLILHDWTLNDSFTIAAGEELRDQFQLELPEQTPLTLLPRCHNKTKVWLQTGLDIASGVDGSDRDFLPIAPTAAMATFLTAMEQCGFMLHSADVEKGNLHGRNFQSTIGCYQELEFRPVGFGGFSIKEVEVSFVLEGATTHVMLEVDRRFSGDGLLSLSLSPQITVADAERQIRGLLRL